LALFFGKNHDKLPTRITPFLAKNLENGVIQTLKFRLSPDGCTGYSSCEYPYYSHGLFVYRDASERRIFIVAACAIL